jgi:hypothetical protein
MTTKKLYFSENVFGQMLDHYLYVSVTKRHQAEVTLFDVGWDLMDDALRVSVLEEMRRANCELNDNESRDVGFAFSKQFGNNFPVNFYNMRQMYMASPFDALDYFKGDKITLLLAQSSATEALKVFKRGGYDTLEDKHNIALDGVRQSLQAVIDRFDSTGEASSILFGAKADKFFSNLYFYLKRFDQLSVEFQTHVHYLDGKQRVEEVRGHEFNFGRVTTGFARSMAATEYSILEHFRKAGHRRPVHKDSKVNPRWSSSSHDGPT